jgi:hypothetical protein
MPWLVDDSQTLRPTLLADSMGSSPGLEGLHHTATDYRWAEEQFLMAGRPYQHQIKAEDVIGTIDAADSKVIYLHRELPPFHAEAMSKHIVEATSNRVPGTLVHRDEVWDRCYEDLMGSRMYAA